MEITAERYTDTAENEWDTFIDRNNRNATFLHSRRFFNHNPDNKTDDASLLFYKNGKLIAVLPACLIQKNGNTIFHSHPRSTYGGFVIDHAVGVEEAVSMVEAAINFARSQQATEVIIRNPFRIFHQLPSDESDYAMWYHGFTILKREVESVIPLCENPQEYYDDSTKRSTKKAWKSVTVKETEDFETYWKILTENLKARHNTEPTHTLEEILWLRHLVGKEKIRLVCAYQEDKMIAGIVLFDFQPTTLHAQYIALDNDYQQFRPLNALIDFLNKTGFENGYKYLNLGTANEGDGKTINFGLFRFKEGFGGKGTLRETMHLFLK